MAALSRNSVIRASRSERPDRAHYDRSSAVQHMLLLTGQKILLWVCAYSNRPS